MGWYGLFICTAMFLCSYDGYMAITNFKNWLQFKLIK